MKQNTNRDYFEEDNTKRNGRNTEPESLMEIIEHLEELAKYPPKSKAGLAKLAYYTKKLKEYNG